MKQWLVISVVLLAVSGCATAPRAAVAPTLTPGAPAMTLHGRPYVPAAWLGSQLGMTTVWDRSRRVLTLRRGGQDILLPVGGRVMLINGRLHRLQAPVELVRGQVVMPSEAADQLAQMLLGARPAVARVTPGAPIRRIVLDAGHGGNDPGAVSRGGLREKDVVLDVARRLRRHLEQAGVEVIMVRSDDRFVPLPQRAEMANRTKADFFISIHANANRSRSLAGMEVYYLSEAFDDATRAWEAAEDSVFPADPQALDGTPPSRAVRATLWDLMLTQHRAQAIELGRAILHAVGSETSLGVRGVRPARFFVLRRTEMPAILVELAYLTNAGDESKLRDPEWREWLARGIAQGIVSYAGRPPTSRLGSRTGLAWR